LFGSAFSFCEFHTESAGSRISFISKYVRPSSYLIATIDGSDTRSVSVMCLEEKRENKVYSRARYKGIIMKSPITGIIIAVVAVVVVASIGIHHQGKSRRVPLDIKLPQPMFVGTPQDFQVDNLEKPLGRPRPPFLAPVGTKNVALGKPVSASDEEPIIGEIEMITDGDKEAADGSYVELGPFLQHVTIDLQAEHEIYAVVIWHYHKEARVYYDVLAQVCNDADFTENVTTLFNDDADNSAGLGVGKDMHYVETNEGKLIDAKGVRARYVRLYSNGNTSDDLNHYIEVQVYGKPVG